MYDITIQSVVELLSLEFYRFKRYKTPITLVIIEIDYEGFFAVIESQIRKTDLYQQIDKNIYAIIYSHTDREGGLCAMKNILEGIDLSGCGVKMAVEEAHISDAGEQLFVERTFAQMAPYEASSS